MSWRTPERVLERWAREDGLALGDTERYFERVERFVSAAPQDPGSVGRDNELLREGAERLGWRVVHNQRAQIHCAGCNTCTYGCPTGAKRSTLVSYLPRAVRFGARVQSDCRVDRVVFDDRRRAVGVDGHLTVAGRHGFRVRANATFVCCGGIQTPALLARSGVRSESGRLGRNLSMHPNAKVVAFFDEDVVGFHGAHQGYQVREFEDEGLVLAAVNLPPGLLASTLPQYGAEMARTMAEYDHVVTAGVLVEDSSTGLVRARSGGRAVASYALDDRDAAAIARGIALLSEAMFAAGARRVMVPFEGYPDLTSGDDLPALRDAPVDKRGMELFTVHMMGTAAMGADPGRHVCDPFGRVFGAEGLHVADAGLFPSPPGVNPMETIMALATRNAERFLSG
jgi:choline dehydrogenase-like flavoprotein